MSEKLASTEIAQRLKKYTIEIFGKKPIIIGGIGWQHGDLIELIKLAERDTRERCAQLCDEILLPIEDWAGTKKEFGQKLCTALAERIRGKV